jgi:1-acyl-sn-glycerol-3-phosphate acyltransferase
MIFPEGTRTPYGSTPVLKRGAANIAVRCGCDLRVVHIHCTERVLTKQSRWYQIPPVKPFFTVSVRERISISTFMAKEEMPLPIAVRQLNRYLQQALTPEIL